MNWIAFPDPRLAVCGLPWFSENSPHLWRLPARLKGVVRDPVWGGAQSPCGGRIRFATDATAIGIRLRYQAHGRMHNMCTIGQMGVDLYVDGGYCKTAFPTEAGDLETIYLEGVPARRREVCLYLPLYHPVEVISVGVNEEASLYEAADFAVPRPVVFYGSSITQGGCSSRGGLSYQAILARALNLDFVNLGFSGQGRGESELAHAVAEIQASCYVVEFAQNCESVEAMRAVYAPFLEILRTKHPQTPILCLTPIFATREAWDPAASAHVECMRDVVRAAVRARHAGGDEATVLVEGDDGEGTVDSSHPNDLGFEAMAAGMIPALVRVLGL